MFISYTQKETNQIIYNEIKKASKYIHITTMFFNDEGMSLDFIKLLNDKFGIQTRGGCSCAGTYGHYLLHVDQETSHDLVCQITSGDLIKKPGWIRMSIHPTTTSEEIKMVCDSIKALAKKHKEHPFNR